MDPNDGALHAALNRGKRSVVLDIEREDEAVLAGTLIEGAALLLTSWRTTCSSPSRTARHRSEARSEPLPGSE